MRIGSFKGVLLATLFIVSIVALAIPIHSSVTIENVGQWETLTNAPEGVGTNNGHRIEAMGNYIYFWAANSTGFYRYDPSAGSWQTLTSAPTSSSYGIGIVRAKDTAGNPAIYIMAGSTSANSQKWYRYTDAGGWSGQLNTSGHDITWTGSGAQTNCNKPANGSEFVWNNGDIIYYFPGSGYDYDRYDWYEYTISTNTWTYMGEFNNSGDPKDGPGDSACLVTIGGEKYIYIQFGHTPSGNYTSAQFWRYQISNGQWTKEAQTGYGADDGADLVWDGGNYLYLWPGAYIEASSGGCDEYRFLQYSISGNTWVALTEQPSPKGAGNGNDDGGSAGIVGDYIYKLKGGDGNGSTLASDFYRYQMQAITPTATATGPKGSTNNPSVSITYTYTLTPTSVKLYYTKDGGTSWTLGGEDTSVDGTFAYNITSGDGTYGWIAVAIGGGSTETDPPAGGTSPEAASLILDRAPTLIAPANGSSTNDNTPTFQWSSVSNPGGVTYQIQIDDNVDFISPLYFAVGLVENNHTLPGENALASGTYFWRVRAVDNVGNACNWSSIWTLFIIVGNRWTQTNWAGGPTKPSLQVGTGNDAYDNFYDNDNVNWLAGVRLDNYLGPRVTDHVVISEFATRGSSSAYDEFVELYNPTSSAINIGGWIFEYWSGAAWVYYGFGTTVAIGTIPSGATIPAHGFYLWGNNRGYVSPGSGPTPDWNTYGNGLSDGASGSPRGIRLKMPDNATVIDTVVFEGNGNTSNAEAEGGYTAPGCPTSATTVSIERKAQSTSTASSMAAGGVDENSGNAYDSNNNYNDWVKRTSRNPQNSSSTLENPIAILVPQFRSAGWFESSIFNAGGVADWKIISWIENKPSGTSIIVKARTGNDNNPYDGGWSGWYQVGNGAENALMENGRYIQYRVELSTTDNAKTPKLSQITLNYELIPVIVRGVDVSISPSSQSELNGVTLIYTVTINNTGNVSDNYSLTAADNDDWSPSVLPTSVVVPAFSSDNTTVLSVTIPSNAIGGTVDNIAVTATGDVSDNDTCIAQVDIARSVSTSISPSSQNGANGATLTYTVTVNNTGNVSDNFSLTPSDDAGWTPSVSPTSRVVAAFSSDNATLSVTIPLGAIGGTIDNITVTATSQTDNTVSGSGSCLAQVSVHAALTPHGPILIVDNDNFTLANGVTSGSGTVSDPYIIENYAIDASTANGIEIRDTTAHFLVRNCVIENGWIAENEVNYYGIKLSNVVNGRIENSTCKNDDYGILLISNSDNNTLANNTCENNFWYGIRLEGYSSNNALINNTCENTKYYGIGLDGADSNTLDNNTIENGLFGIYLYDSENIKMRNDALSNNRYNFGMEGTTLSHFVHDIDNSNLVNGKPIRYLIGHSNEVIGPSPEMGYLGLVNCDNIQVENLVLKHNVQGILIAGTQDSRVKNCIFENNGWGIYLWGSDNNILDNNTCENGGRGIQFLTSNNNTLTNSICEDDNYFGIRLVYSNNNMIKNSTFSSDNEHGVRLYSSENNIVENNTISNDNLDGIWFERDSVNNTVRNNNVTSNNRYGIYILNSNDNNRIYHNNFANNANQAYDNSSNYWDNGYPSGGNYWSNYTGVDENYGENQNLPGSDDIGDTPYNIPGGSNMDHYPLMSPWQSSVVRGVTVSISPSYQVGANGATLIYTVTVNNLGNVSDNFALTPTDNASPTWSPSVLPTWVVVPAFSSDNATLSVTIPPLAIGGTTDNITVTANGTGDNASASCTATVTSVSYTLNLVTGWNLVCFPVDNSPTTPNRIFTGLTYLTDYIIYSWNAPSGPYVLVGPADVLKDNVGYWIYINTNKTLTWSGTQPTSRDVHLVAGWNLVGFPVVNGSTTPSNKFAGLTYLTNYTIYSWSAPSGPYVLQGVSNAFKDNTGYWVLIDRTWTVTVP